MATTTHQATNSSRRRTVIQAFTSPRDRLSYLWLALAIVLLPFGTARWAIPLAAWLYPIFLLRFVRTQPLWRGVLLALLATVLVLEVAWLGFLPPLPGALYILIVFAIGVLYTLPYLIDRVVTPRLGGILGTLVFPLAVTTVWYLFDLVSPWGQYISLKDLPHEVQRREDQATRQNRETAPPDQKVQVEASGASWVCICCRPA